MERSLEEKKTGGKVLQSFKKVKVGKELVLDSLLVYFYLSSLDLFFAYAILQHAPLRQLYETHTQSTCYSKEASLF